MLSKSSTFRHLVLSFLILCSGTIAFGDSDLTYQLPQATNIQVGGTCYFYSAISAIEAALYRDGQLRNAIDGKALEIEYLNFVAGNDSVILPVDAHRSLLESERTPWLVKDIRSFRRQLLVANMAAQRSPLDSGSVTVGWDVIPLMRMQLYRLGAVSEVQWRDFTTLISKTMTYSPELLKPVFRDISPTWIEAMFTEGMDKSDYINDDALNSRLQIIKEVSSSSLALLKSKSRHLRLDASSFKFSPICATDKASAIKAAMQKGIPLIASVAIGPDIEFGENFSEFKTDPGTGGHAMLITGIRKMTDKLGRTEDYIIFQNSWKGLPLARLKLNNSGYINKLSAIYTAKEQLPPESTACSIYHADAF